MKRSIEQPAEQPKKFAAEKPESEYHFKEIADIEPAMISLVEKLKENIEVGKYDVLISDELGGRIPTIVLRKIIAEKNPDRDIKGYFISAGQGVINFEAVENFILKNKLAGKKALVVTEYISSGASLRHLSNALEEGGLNEFDIATAYIKNDAAAAGVLKIIEKDHKLLFGEIVPQTPSYYFEQKEFSGVWKSVVEDWAFALHPRRADNFKEEAQPAVEKAREDANLLAENVIKKVWK